MTTTEKIKELHKEITSLLFPLINNDYVLYDLPYHNNIGDLLIWKGELSFLKHLPYRMLCCNSIQTYREARLNPETIILLHGGGNFGDVWRDMQDFRLAVIKRYPENRIIIFPQTVFYENKALMQEDARIMAQHKDLTICARDRISYNILKEHFDNQILLVPDMAFCIPLTELDQYAKKPLDKTLFLKRSDKELKNANYFFQSRYPLTTSDWPSMEQSDIVQLGMSVFLRCSKLSLSFLPSLTDKYACFYREKLIKQGVQFVSQYKEIYTTRLHVAILSTLLGKPFHFFDNSYGKNRAFYETWLNEVDNAIFER